MAGGVVVGSTLPYGVEVYDGVLHPDLCERLIAYFESTPKSSVNTLINGKKKTFPEIILDDQTMSENIFLRIAHGRIERNIDRFLDDYVACPMLRKQIKDGCYSLQPRMKRYDVGHDFPLHSDDSSLAATTRRFAYIVYLNENFKGGNTVFKNGKREVARILPKQGSMLTFPIHPIYMHEGEEVTEGSKYLLNGFATVITSQARALPVPGQREPTKLEIVQHEIGMLTAELIDAANQVFSE